jgi:hypothetical protein
MSAQTLDMFAGVVKEIAAGPRVSSFQNLTADLLRRLSEKGLTLEQCADRRLLNRSISTLEGHCREYGIRFSDYTPSNMRKHLMFVPSGDFLELNGSEVEAVAGVLGIVVTKTGDTGEPRCGIPAWSFDDAKEKLKAAGYVAKKGKAPKKRKVAGNG